MYRAGNLIARLLRFVTTTPDTTTLSIRASTVRFTSDFGGGFAFTGAFRVFDTVRAGFFALGTTDFGCFFSALFAARLAFSKSTTN